MLSLFWGFRLTIWNVNSKVAFSFALPATSFRLTIWNVNMKGLTSNRSNPCQF